MAIIPQMILFDYTTIEKLGDLERLQLVLEGINDETLMRKLEAKRQNGRDDYPVRIMWNYILAMKVCGHPSVEALRRELGRNSQLRKICGQNDALTPENKLVPPSRAFSNFIKSLSQEQEEVDRIFNQQVIHLYGQIPGFGQSLAGDGKYLDSFAKRPHKEQTDTDNRTENDAEWSVKETHYTDKNGKPQVKKEYHYGFKAHIICDVRTELPIAYSVTPGNVDEKKEMKALLGSPVLSDKARRELAEHLLLDRGYDSLDMIRTIKGMGIVPIIDIRNCWKDKEATKQYKNTNIVYDYKGTVYYVDANNGEHHKMKYEGYDKQKKCLRYSHEGKTYKIRISYDERIFLPIARDSDKFKKIYKGRTAVERLNSRLDRDYMFEDHTIRGLRKMKLMLSLSLVVMNGMAVGKLKAGKEKLRSLKNAA